MKILVTGSEGSLMQATIPHLIAQGHEVVGVDSLFRYNERMNLAKGYEFEKIDLTNQFDVDALISRVRPDGIIQAAARIFGVGGFNKYCADILYNDPVLHGNILQSAVKWKVKRVTYISSSMVYENCPQDVDLPVYEDMVDEYPAPYTEYGMSKYVGERLSKAYYKQYGLEYTIWRPFNIITPYEKSEGDIGTSHVFADYIKNIVIEKKNPLPIIGDGSQIRCFTWIDDVAKVIGTMSFDDKSLNETFNLGNPEPFTMAQLAHIIYNKAVDRKLIPAGTLSFETVADYFADVKVRIPNIEKAERVLGFAPTKKLNESIKYCLDNLRG